MPGLEKIELLCCRIVGIVFPLGGGVCHASSTGIERLAINLLEGGQEKMMKNDLRPSLEGLLRPTKGRHQQIAPGSIQVM